MNNDHCYHGSFWIQFTCGALLGLFFGFPLARNFADSVLLGALIFLIVIGACALGAAFWGDRFWEGI